MFLDKIKSEILANHRFVIYVSASFFPYIELVTETILIMLHLYKIKKSSDKGGSAKSKKHVFFL